MWNLSLQCTDSQVLLVVKDPPANAGDMVPGLERCPGGEHGNPLQCSCLEKPMDKGAWQVTVHGVAKSQDATEATADRLSTGVAQAQQLQHVVVALDMWDLSSPARDGTSVSCIALWILNHWTCREV